MPEVQATLKNYRQAPRKVRLLAGLVRGKSVPQALADLRFSTKRGAEPIEKLVKSAVANAKDRFGTEEKDLIISRIAVDEGIVFKRFRAAARGRARPIHKKSSHVTVVVDEKVEKIASKAKKTQKAKAVTSEKSEKTEDKK